MQLPESPRWPLSSLAPSLHHLAQCNTPLPVGVPCHGTVAAAPGSALRVNALHRLFSGGSVASPAPPPSRFYGRTDFKTTKLQTSCVLILSGGSVCSAPMVWCVTIWSAASSGTECRLAQTQSRGHLCNCSRCWPQITYAALGPRSPSPPPFLLFTSERSL